MVERGDMGILSKCFVSFADTSSRLFDFSCDRVVNQSFKLSAES